MAADEKAVGSSYFQSVSVSLESEAKSVMTGEGVNVEVRRQPLTSCVSRLGLVSQARLLHGERGLGLASLRA